MERARLICSIRKIKHCITWACGLLKNWVHFQIVLQICRLYSHFCESEIFITNITQLGRGQDGWTKTGMLMRMPNFKMAENLFTLWSFRNFCALHTYWKKEGLTHYTIRETWSICSCLFYLLSSTNYIFGLNKLWH